LRVGGASAAVVHPATDGARGGHSTSWLRPDYPTGPAHDAAHPTGPAHDTARPTGPAHNAACPTGPAHDAGSAAPGHAAGVLHDPPGPGHSSTTARPAGAADHTGESVTGDRVDPL